MDREAGNVGAIPRREVENSANRWRRTSVDRRGPPRSLARAEPLDIYRSCLYIFNYTNNDHGRIDAPAQGEAFRSAGSAFDSDETKMHFPATHTHRHYRTQAKKEREKRRKQLSLRVAYFVLYYSLLLLLISIIFYRYRHHPSISRRASR